MGDTEKLLLTKPAFSWSVVGFFSSSISDAQGELSVLDSGPILPPAGITMTGGPAPVSKGEDGR